MHLLELSNIGKIYTSQGTVAVGIRGVNLSFDLGEFVAITGQSGSGKSTLLNIISGMDSYEEGEMYIKGETTSHYINEDWEKYREKYISFIFQDYNIIDSFTVLENVELALLHMEDAKERKRRAKELIRRVGLESHMNQRGSLLSGGQKQRTVIARALAKDSPIILADEPTGNLDSQTSKEIIELLKEISKDKLIIVVTHNFDEVEECATREIRVYDGAINSDRQIRKLSDSEHSISEDTKEDNSSKKDKWEIKDNLKKGFKIGLTIFRRMPRLSLFLNVLFTVCAICLFFFVGILGKEIKCTLMDDNYLFHDENNRVVVTRRDGSPISEDEIAELANEYNASDYEQIDILRDTVGYRTWNDYQMNDYGKQTASVLVEEVEDVGTPDVGRYPESCDECLLYIPYSLKNDFGDSAGCYNTVRIPLANSMQEVEFKVAGIKYYADNNRIGKAYVTKETYDACAKMGFFQQIAHSTKVNDLEDINLKLQLSFAGDKDKPTVYVNSKLMKEMGITENAKWHLEYTLNKDYGFQNEEENSNNISETFMFNTEDINVVYNDTSNRVVINPLVFAQKIGNTVSANYHQGSLCFETQSQRKSAIKGISGTEYMAISSDTKVLPYSDAFFAYLSSAIGMLIVLILLIFFMTFVVKICTRSSVDAFKKDIGIMRSMGIRVNIIKIAVYFRMLLAMIAPVICVAVLALFGYRNAFFNANVMFMYPIHYLLIFVGLLVVVVRSTKKQIKRLFSTTVKKSLKKGETK